MFNIQLNRLKNKVYNLKQNKKLIYTIYGVCFGIVFPVFSIVFELTRVRLPINIGNIIYLHTQTPLLYVISSAPVFLGLFAYVAGTAQSKVQKILAIDSLTGLRNRYASDQLLRHYKANLETRKGYLTVVIINIRSLKKTNSLMGMAFGNEMLIVVANLLRSMCTNGEQLFRITGTEFMLLNMGEPIKELTINISKTLSKPIKVLGLYCLVDVNIGVSYCTATNYDCKHIIDNAYNAMNYHKYSQDQTYVVFDESMRPKIEDIEMESEIFLALEKNELFLVYQPIVSTATGQICGCESLLRWKNHSKGIISPLVFVPILERTNLIVPVGFWILRTACAQAKRWQEQFDREDLFISINVSVSQLFDVQFIEKLDDMVQDIGIDKNTIRLEITESISEEKRGFVRGKIDALGQCGYRLSIDDFGTGYSSLAELDSMPLYSLKVDKSFVDRIGKGANQSPVIEMIVDMAHKMELAVVVEGVETKEQYEYLKTVQCDYIQGFYFSKPLSVEDVEAKL